MGMGMGGGVGNLAQMQAAALGGVDMNAAIVGCVVALVSCVVPTWLWHSVSQESVYVGADRCWCLPFATVLLSGAARSYDRMHLI